MIDCPECGVNDSKVYDSRMLHGQRKRYRQCKNCDARFFTIEIELEYYKELTKRKKLQGKPRQLVWDMLDMIREIEQEKPKELLREMKQRLIKLNQQT